VTKKPGKTLAEAGNVQQKIEYRGKRYEMTCTDKISDVDGITESHLSYEPLDRPKGTKSRGNFATGMTRCLGKCKCFDGKCDKKPRKKKK
jgi:hypothetical protein